jgi:hypothetical protein
MAVHTKSEGSFKQYKGRRNRYWERMGILTKHIEISSVRKLKKNKETEQKKIKKKIGITK